ncbi:50S ribosomal protein L25 [Paenibacillus apiarius]|uniref:50S ribosomal protein L25 n=1 Tax=Paenibacillus apiarius TaxID=46240 RepID=UPI00197E9034|nr:50S ribosomal protein L25 [Paenibacillus apiarius]MBN3526607.1 50S ribosomal protein L25 [Paenibacillus apiarius]
MTPIFAAATRTNEKRSALRELRSEGRTPCVILDKGTSTMIHIDTKEFTKWVRDGLSKKLELSIDGADSVSVEVKAIQRHPVTNEIIHVDLLADGVAATA